MNYAQLLIDADMAEMVMYALGGIEVSDQSLSVDIISEMGPFKDYLGHKSTFEFRRCQSRPSLFNRQGRDTWLRKQGRDLTTVAAERARVILETHKPAELPDQVKLDLRRIINDAEKSCDLPLSQA
jgi:trimethylamine--corrinoid protein Co-methyltransferase